MCHRFTRTQQPRWSLLSVRRPVRRGYEQSRSASGWHDNFQHVQWFANDFRGEHIINGERLVVEYRIVVCICIAALVDRYLRPLCVFQSILMRVTRRQHRVANVGSDHA